MNYERETRRFRVKEIEANVVRAYCKTFTTARRIALVLARKNPGVRFRVIDWADPFYQHREFYCKLPYKMTCEQRLREIAAIIERVDNRAMAADGPVTPTLKEMTQTEISRIYALAIGKVKR